MKDGFSYKDYVRLLSELEKAGYSCAAFPAAEELLKRNKKFVLMRHDVDMDLGKALELAEIEKSFGILATYFFMLRTNH